jgi:hypothetical protein
MINQHMTITRLAAFMMFFTYLYAHLSLSMHNPAMWFYGISWVALQRSRIVKWVQVLHSLVI